MVGFIMKRAPSLQNKDFWRKSESRTDSCVIQEET
jgi:hypothetical protein